MIEVAMKTRAGRVRRDHSKKHPAMTSEKPDACPRPAPTEALFQSTCWSVVLDLDASGNPTWMQSFGGESGDSDDYGSSWPSEIITAVGAVADGSVVLAGEMDGVVSWGGATFAAAAPGDLVIARYSR